MPRHDPRLTRLVVSVALVLLVPWGAAAQEDPGGRITLSATRDSLALSEAVAVIERMLLSSELVSLSVVRDRSIFGRTHETLAQLYRGVPVYGGSVTRQRAVGTTLSVFGTLYEGIDLETTPVLAADEALRLLEELSGSVSVSPSLPALTIFPTPDGRFHLTYRATMVDYTTYFIDANSGLIVTSMSEIDNQSAVGIGLGALGDLKKVSARRVSGGFTAEDELRPTSIITADSKGDPDALDRMLLARVLPGLGGFLQSDIASDSDNDWRDPSQAGIVDGHVETGFTHDYFFLQHDWPGMDGAGGRVYDIVNDFSTMQAFLGSGANAFFIGPPFGPEGNGAMAWGETSAGVPINTLDIVAHEYMHGVTQFAVAGGAGIADVLVGSPGPVNARVDLSAFGLGDGVFSCDFLKANLFDFLCIDGRFVLVSNHPGAINEGFADVFGTSAEFFYQPPGNGVLQADYLNGEDVVGFGPIRSLVDPGSLPAIGPFGYPDHVSKEFRFPFGPPGVVFWLFTDPDAVTSDVFVIAHVFSSAGPDFGGVHLNATLLGHAFYLGIEGGTNATSGRTVTGVGAANRAQVERVFFRAMVTLMPQSPTFGIAAAAIRQSAIDLFGFAGSVSNAVSGALAAVGLSPGAAAAASSSPSSSQEEDSARNPGTTESFRNPSRPERPSTRLEEDGHSHDA